MKFYCLRYRGNQTRHSLWSMLSPEKKCAVWKFNPDLSRYNGALGKIIKISSRPSKEVVNGYKNVSTLCIAFVFQHNYSPCRSIHISSRNNLLQTEHFFDTHSYKFFSGEVKIASTESRLLQWLCIV